MIQIDLEMPKNCAECPCFRHDNINGLHMWQCNLSLKTFSEVPKERDADCGLLEVKEPNIGDKITLWAERRNIRQSELAERTGITKVALSRYMNGGRVPKATTLYKIAKVLKVSMEELCEV